MAKGQADPHCETCGGLGHIFIDSMTSKRCVCLLRSLYALKLGRLMNVKTAKNSPLLKKLDSNLYLIVDDDTIAPHLKASFIMMGLDARWVYIDDSNVLQTWLGGTNSAGADNIPELMEIPFMALRLGVVGYKNVALSGVLCELLMGRALSNRPTWIITPRPVTQDCLEYSTELIGILKRYFEQSTFKVAKTHEDTEAPEELTVKSKKPVKMANINDLLRGV
jgi:hypothetical protein